MSQTKQEELRGVLTGLLNDDTSLLLQKTYPQSKLTAWSKAGRRTLSKSLSNQVIINPSPGREEGPLGELGSGSNQQDAKEETLIEAGRLVPAFQELSSRLFSC